jgi:Xaa-Pro aminopeptidase
MSNLARLQQALGEAGLPAMLVTDLANVAWLTGFTGTYGVAIVTATQARFVTDSRYTIQAGEEVKGFEIATFGSPTDGSEFLGAQLADLKVSEIGFEASSVTYETYEKWGKAFGSVRLVPATKILPPLRMIKSADEIAKVRQACEVADKTFEHLQRLVRPGVSELELELELEFFIRRQGFGIAFPPIVVSGARSARPHGHASEKLLEAGDLVTFDFGARVGGYNSDLTRTVGVVELAEKPRAMYAAVLEAQLAALDAIKPGARAADVDRLAREVLAKHGLAQYFGHGLGHGLGSAVHDYGRMNATSEDVFEPGQIWTVEPGVYVEGVGGVRIEDDVLVTDSGIEVFNRTPKELLILAGS